MKPKNLAGVVVDTTEQPNAVMFPTDAKSERENAWYLVRLAAHVGVEVRQSYASAGLFPARAGSGAIRVWDKGRSHDRSSLERSHIAASHWQPSFPPWRI
jgi:hypothetical protein